MIFRKSNSFNLIEVLKGCKANNGSAQKQLFSQYYGLAKRICLKYAGNSDETDEMINDGFIKVFANLDKYETSHSFEAWFRTVVVRTCIDYYRKNHSKVTMIDIDTTYDIEHNDFVIEKLNAEEILNMVQQLPASYRTVFSLFAVDGYSHAEIAEMLGINEGTSRSNLSKARVKLQEMMKNYLGKDFNQKDHVN